jgi:hypothetical protein
MVADRAINLSGNGVCHPDAKPPDYFMLMIPVNKPTLAGNL